MFTKNKKNFFIASYKVVVLLFLSLTLFFGRSFMGLYIFSLRIGEYLIGFSLILLIYLLIFQKRYVRKFDNKLYITVNLLIITFFVFAFLKGDNLLNPYVFRSSMYIWVISFISLGLLFFKLLSINKNLSFFFNLLLFMTYIMSVFVYPEIFANFFKEYADKFDYLKASEIMLVFVFAVYINKTVYSSKLSFFIFNLQSFLFLPLFLVMSRGAALGLVLFYFLEFYLNRKIITENIPKFLSVLLASVLLFVLSSYFIVEDEVVEDEGFSYVVQDVLETKNTSTDSFFSFYSHSGRLFSQDGNINFRLQIWQDVFNYSHNGNVYLPRKGFTKLDYYKGYEQIIGTNYSNKIPTMNNPDYQGLDRTNESVHNYLVNIYARGGLIHLVLFMLFFYYLFRFKSIENKLYYVSIVTPLVVVSMFDASMDSPNYAFAFFFLIGTFLSNVEFDYYKNSDQGVI